MPETRLLKSTPGAVLSCDELPVIFDLRPCSDRLSTGFCERCALRGKNVRVYPELIDGFVVRKCELCKYETRDR